MKKFDILTKYIDTIAVDYKGSGWGYSANVGKFIEDIWNFCQEHPEYELTQYGEVLERYGLAWDWDVMVGADVSKADDNLTLALLMGAVRADRFSDGTLGEFIGNGCIKRWLERLAAIDVEDDEEMISLDWRVSFKPGVHAFITMAVTGAEYDLLYECAKEMEPVDQYPGLEDLTQRLHVAAVSICREDGADVSMSDNFNILIPKEITIEAEMDLADEMEDEE